MRSRLPALGAILLAAACDRPAPAAAPTPAEERAREFTRAMKTIDAEYEGLHEDLAAGTAADQVRVRLSRLRAAATEASRIPYRSSEAENRDLAFEFTKFLEAADRLKDAAWSGEEGKRTWRRLGTACSSCHDLYRVDE